MGAPGLPGVRLSYAKRPRGTQPAWGRYVDAPGYGGLVIDLILELWDWLTSAEEPSNDRTYGVPEPYG